LPMCLIRNFRVKKSIEEIHCVYLFMPNEGEKGESGGEKKGNGHGQGN